MKSIFRAIRSGLTQLYSWFQELFRLPCTTPKVRYIANLDEVTVTRDGDSARIEYKEVGISVTDLEIGPEIVQMSDSDIVGVHNERLRNDVKQAAKYKHIVFEVPLGSPQIEYFARCDQWVPRGCVLRCLIEIAQYGEIIVKIDEQHLRLKEFGKLLAAYGDWGMRIEFMPMDEVHHRPLLEVREPR
jgi:hypothetical protein